MIKVLFFLGQCLLHISGNYYAVKEGGALTIRETLISDVHPSGLLFLVNQSNKTICSVDRVKITVRQDKCDIQNETITIRLLNVTEQDGGDYKLAKGSNTNIFAEAFTLYVIDKPTVHQTEKAAVFNQPLHLECRSKSIALLNKDNLSFTIEWTRNSKILTAIDNLQFEKEVLFIKRFRWRKRQAFTCKTVFLFASSDESAAYPILADHGPRGSYLIPKGPEYVRKEGEAINITCVSDCSPKCETRWTRETEIVSRTDVLAIDHLDRSDQNNYTCTVSNKYGEVALDVHVTVEYPPSDISLQVPTSPVLEHSTVTLECNSVCNPACNISLEKDGRIFKRLLPMKGILRDKAGTYTCKASNKHGQREKSFELDVVYPPEVTSLKIIENVITVGSDIHLKCDIDSLRRTNITWTRVSASETMHSESIVIDKTFTAELTLSNIQCEDTGSYACSAVNDYGKDSATKSIDVTCRPSSVERYSDQQFYQTVGSANTYFYDIVANPQPTVEKWTLTDTNGTLTQVLGNSDFEEDVELLSEVPFYRLKLIHMNMKTSYGGHYTVTLENSKGSYLINYAIDQQDKPEQPKNLTVLNTTSTSIDLAFLRGYDGNAAQYFQVLIEPSKSPQNISATCEDIDDVCTTELTDLTPGKRYVMSLRAVNKIGASLYTDNVQTYTKDNRKSKIGEAFTRLVIICGVIAAALLFAGTVYLLLCRPCKRKTVQLRKLKTETVSSEATDEIQVDLWEAVAADQGLVYPETEGDKRMSEFRISKMCIESVTYTTFQAEDDGNRNYVNMRCEKTSESEPSFNKYICDSNSESPF